MAAGSARLLRPLILRDLLVALENAEIHNERLTGQCFLDPKSQKEEAPVPQPALKLQKNCCAADESGRTDGKVSVRALRNDQAELYGSLPDVTSFDIQDNGIGFTDEHRDSFDTLSKNDLIHYIALRRKILDIFGKSLEVDESGTYSSEGVVHDIVFPRRGDTEIPSALTISGLWMSV